MVQGAECPMCADVHLLTNDHSDLVFESDVAITRLHRNQTHAGYSVVVLKRHVAELHDLADDEHDEFWDVRRLSRAVTNLFHPVKVDSLVMGHLCPHVHCHVYPQYQGDDPRALINIQEGAVRLSSDEQARRVRQLRDALDQQPAG